MDKKRLDQIRRAHKSAEPTRNNPAWMNSHGDVGSLLTVVDELLNVIKEAEVCLALSGFSPVLSSQNPIEHLLAMMVIARGGKIKREHIASAACWCEPVTDFVNPETGAAVLVHKQIQ